MKSDPIYLYYLTYLNNRLFEGDISKGSVSLLKISKTAFDDFKYKFENDELFKSKIIKLHRADNRDKKIDDIFSDLD
jgi:hypothetical protein